MRANYNFVIISQKNFFSRFKYSMYLCSSNTGEKYMAEKTTSEFSLIIFNLQLSHSVFLAIVKHRMYTQFI